MRRTTFSVLKLFILLLCLHPQPAGAQGQNLGPGDDCLESLTSEAPFHVTEVHENDADRFRIGGRAVTVRASTAAGHLQGTSASDPRLSLMTEPFRSSVGGRVSRLIRRGTVVRVEAGSPVDDRNDLMVKVKVVSASSTGNAWIVNPSSGRTGEVAKSGDEGYVWNRALRGVGKNDLFVLNQNTRLLPFGALQSVDLPRGTALRPVMLGDQFKIVQCGSSPPSYLYQTHGAGSHQSARFLMDSAAGSCSDFRHLTSDSYQSLEVLSGHLERLYGSVPGTALADLEINEFGMVRLPMQTTTAYGSEIPEAAFDQSFVRYRGSDPEHSDGWVEPQAACALLSLARDWQSSCSHRDRRKCAPQIGDIAFITPGTENGGPRDPLGHQHHRTGTCIDMRPFRLDGTFRGVNIATGRAEYDAITTQEFVRFLVREGASPIYFNDAALVDSGGACTLDDPSRDLGKGVLSCAGHDNHIHFCLEPGRVSGC